MRRWIYLDYAATTPVDPAVVKIMSPYLSEEFGNPGSLHSFGQKASAAVFAARQKVARAIGAHYSEIIFIAGATEANNTALRGAVRYFQEKKQGVKPRIIISAIEHESILKTAKDLERAGVEVVIVPVDTAGIIHRQRLKAALNEWTVLVSVMFANNEVGTIQPLVEISKIVREFRGKESWPLIHTDAVQAFNYLSCDVNRLGVDLLTLSSQKIYGPKGVGALYVRSYVKGNLRTYPINPIMTGGGQEQGLRSGTENVAGIVGFGEAVEIAERLREKEVKRLADLRDDLLKKLKKILPGAKLNGDAKKRLPHNINIYFSGRSAEEIIIALDLQGIAIASGSACTARSPEPSHVLLAMGASKEIAKNALRITLGRQTTQGEINTFLSALKKLTK